MRGIAIALAAGCGRLGFDPTTDATALGGSSEVDDATTVADVCVPVAERKVTDTAIEELEVHIARRSGGFDVVHNEAVAGLQWTRLDDAGQVVTSAQIATGPPGSPSLARWGSDTVLTWDDRRGGSTADIYALRITEDGPTADSPINLMPGNQQRPRVACGPTACAIAYFDFRTGFVETYVSMWAGDAATETRVANGGYASPTTASSSFGIGYMVEATGAWEHHFTTFDGVGSIGTARHIITLSTGFAPGPIWNGSEFLYPVVDSNDDIVVHRLAPDGTPQGEPVRFARAFAPFGFHLVTRSTGLAIVWSDSTGVWAQLLDRDLLPIGGATMVSTVASNNASEPSAVENAQGITLVWRDFRGGQRDVFLATVCPEI